MSWTDPCGNCGEHRADCSCKGGYSSVATEQKYFDAHIGISPNQDVHLRKYHSVICSNCVKGINFKILQEEFDALEKLLHHKTKPKDE